MTWLKSWLIEVAGNCCVKRLAILAANMVCIIHRPPLLSYTLFLKKKGSILEHLMLYFYLVPGMSCKCSFIEFWFWNPPAVYSQASWLCLVWVLWTSQFKHVGSWLTSKSRIQITVVVYKCNLISRLSISSLATQMALVRASLDKCCSDTDETILSIKHLRLLQMVKIRSISVNVGA